VNPYLLQLLNASWLNKASLAKIFNGKFAMAIHELKNQNNQWQFSLSVYLGTKNKEKSKELLSLIEKFTALVNPNFNSQIKNDVIYAQFPESDGLVNTSTPVQNAIRSFTAVASGSGLILHIGNSPYAQKLSTQLQKNQKFSTQPTPPPYQKSQPIPSSYPYPPNLSKSPIKQHRPAQKNPSSNKPHTKSSNKSCPAPPKSNSHNRTTNNQREVSISNPTTKTSCIAPQST
jgi:hypothetical protein